MGDAITVTEDETPDQLKERVEVAMRQMIAKHHVQGGVGKALMERIKSLVWSLNFNCPMCGGFLHNKQTYAQED